MNQGGDRAWGIASVVVAALVVAPLVVLPLAFARPSAAWSRVAADLLPEAVRNTVVLAVGVAAGTAVLGTALAVLVCFYEFPLRRTVEWALVLPLAMPAYIFTFVLLGQYDPDSPVQRALRVLLGRDVTLPELRTTTGAITVLTLVLYPYVYLVARAAFLAQPPGLLEVARSSGCSQLGAIRRVALPLARPAIAAGTGLAAMEAVADFGAVNLLNHRSLTDAIHRVWYGAFDRDAALRLGTVLLGLVLLLVAVEHCSRRAGPVARAARAEGRVARRELRGLRAVPAMVLPLGVLGVVVIGPTAQLVAWSVQAVRDGTYDTSLLQQARTSALLAFLAASLAVGVAVVVVFARRLRPSRTRRAAVRSASAGYAVPGSVAAAAVFLVAQRAGGAVDVVLTGTLAALVLAYLVRFAALAVGTVETHLDAVPPALDQVARSLGAGRRRLLADVHLPLLSPAIGTAFLLVFVEVVKELPATALLRPFGLESLSLAIWEATKESLYETAALPALCLLAVSALPVIFVVRTTAGSRPT